MSKKKIKITPKSAAQKKPSAKAQPSDSPRKKIKIGQPAEPKPEAHPAWRRYTHTNLYAIAISLGVLFLIMMAFLFWPEAKTPVDKLPVVQAKPPIDPKLLAENAYFLLGDTYLVLKNAPYEGVDQLRQTLTDLALPQLEQDRLFSYLKFQNEQDPSARYFLLANIAMPERPELLVMEPSQYARTVYYLQKDTLPVALARELRFETRSLFGIIDQDYWQPLQNYPMGNKLLNRMETILRSKVNFYRIQPGDQFKVLYRVKLIDERVVDLSEVLAVQFTPKKRQTISAFFFPARGQAFYVDETGRSLAQSFWRSPVKFAQVSSAFGTRFHPTKKREMFHAGVDFAAREGTPIYAVADGKVEIARRSMGPNGIFVKLQHPQSYETFYLHMSKFGKGIQKGATVKQGQILGYVGSTGRATGPHVCFHMRHRGKPIDSQTVPLPEPAPLAQAYFPAFVARKDSLIAQLELVRKFDLP